MRTSHQPKILFEDQHLVVLSKPAGLLSQGDESEEPNLVDWLREHFGRYYVGLVHRLDRNTSGLMVVAKRTKSARRLTEDLKSGELSRIYRAWLVGNLKRSQTWEHHLVKDRQKNEVAVSKRKSSESKKAMLKVKPIEKGSWDGHPLTLAEFSLQTGRSHQIRVQSVSEGYPVLGDTKYARDKSRKLKPFGRPALHSYQIKFPHPMSREIMIFVDDLPKDMTRVKRA